MIVVLASQFDEVAKTAVSAWRGSADITLLTVEDMLTVGWVVPAQRIAEAKFAAAGRSFWVRDITGLINLLPKIYDFELPTIYQEDRGYVAAELFAFLVWWLSVLPCPVYNRPTAGCLNGPSWSLGGWIRACQRAGVPIRPDANVAGDGHSPDQHRMGERRSTLVIRGRHYGALWARECVTLATLAKTEFLEVFFCKYRDGWVFDAVNLLPPLQSPEVREMVWRSLTTR